MKRLVLLNSQYGVDENNNFLISIYLDKLFESNKRIGVIKGTKVQEHREDCVEYYPYHGILNFTIEYIKNNEGLEFNKYLIDIFKAFKKEFYNNSVIITVPLNDDDVELERMLRFMGFIDMYSLDGKRRLTFVNTDNLKFGTLDGKSAIIKSEIGINLVEATFNVEYRNSSVIVSEINYVEPIIESGQKNNYENYVNNIKIQIINKIIEHFYNINNINSIIFENNGDVPFEMITDIQNDAIEFKYNK